MNWKDRLLSRAYIGATIAGVSEFLKMAFPNNAKVYAVIQVLGMVLSVFGMREAVANTTKTDTQ